jgi:hypothetical protein
LLGSRSLLSPEKGRQLFEKVSELLNDGAEVILDFADCQYLSSSFFNESIGKQLIERRWSAAELQENVRWKNLAEDDEVDLLLAIENAVTKLHLIEKDIDPDDFYENNLPDS